MYCLFCHKDIQFRKVCTTCRSGFVRWSKEHTNIGSELAIHRVLASVPFCNVKLPRYSGRKWPGFYTATAQWVVPDSYCTTDKQISWCNAPTVLTDLLRGQGISLESEIHLRI